MFPYSGRLLLSWRNGSRLRDKAACAAFCVGHAVGTRCPHLRNRRNVPSAWSSRGKKHYVVRATPRTVQSLVLSLWISKVTVMGGWVPSLSDGFPGAEKKNKPMPMKVII